MADLRKIWGNGSLVIVLFLALPGLVFLERLGYFPSETATPLVESDSQRFIAPDFALPDPHGDIHRLSALRGRVVLLNFWTTWCPPCEAAMPALEKFYRDYKDRGLTVLAVSSDHMGVAVVDPFVKQYGLSFPVLLDQAGETTRMYGVSSLPTTYLLDQQGHLVTVAIGDHLWADNESQAVVTSLLNSTASSLGEDTPTMVKRPPGEDEDGIGRRVR